MVPLLKIPSELNSHRKAKSSHHLSDLTDFLNQRDREIIALLRGRWAASFTKHDRVRQLRGQLKQVLSSTQVMYL